MVGLGLAAWAIMAGPVWAQGSCVALAPTALPPEAHRPVAPVKPERPACINPNTNVSTCRPAVLRKWNQDIEAFNSQLSQYEIQAHAYIRELNAYTQSAADYANCEVQKLNSETAALNRQD
jgi:hypothetical protein